MLGSSSIEKLEKISFLLKEIHKDLKSLKEISDSNSDILKEKGSSLNEKIEKLSKKHKGTSLVDRMRELTQMIINQQWVSALEFVVELNNKSLEKIRFLRNEKYCQNHRNVLETEKIWWVCDRCDLTKKEYDKVWGGKSKEIIADCFYKQEDSN